MKVYLAVQSGFCVFGLVGIVYISYQGGHAFAFNFTAVMALSIITVMWHKIFEEERKGRK